MVVKSHSLLVRYRFLIRLLLGLLLSFSFLSLAVFRGLISLGLLLLLGFNRLDRDAVAVLWVVCQIDLAHAELRGAVSGYKGRSEGHSFISVQVDMESVLLSSLLEDLLHLRDTNASSNDFNLVDIGCFKSSLLESFLSRGSNSSEQVFSFLLEVASLESEFQGDVIKELRHLNDHVLVG